MLDRADALTREIVAGNSPADLRLLDVDFGDVGLARNHAVRAARGDYIAFLDADDLWGAEWLARAAPAAHARDGPTIWHPEVNIHFGTARHLFVHIDMESEAFRPDALIVRNHWSALSFAARELYLGNPYPASDLQEGFGFEDWAWNMQTIGRGIVHKVVPGTGHAIRRRPDRSLAWHAAMADAVPCPGRYIERFIGAR